MEKSDKRAITSPLNGAKGGVKTEEGKEISSRNSYKHGILANYNTDLDEMTFEDAYDMFAKEFGDGTPSRKVLISQLAVLHIRLNRCARFETEYIREKLNPPKFERRLVKKGNELNISDIFTPDVYEDVLVSPGEPMTLSPQVLSDLDNVYTKYESQFLSRFCHIIDLLTRSAK